MINSTQVTFFTLSAYVDTGIFKYFYFLIVLAVYIATLSANVLIIVVICITRSLHEPMYLFLLSLFANELYGSTGLFPFLLVQILSDVHTISYSLCFLQVFCLYSYSTIEFLTIAVMSYDRHLAICYPLQYKTRMTFNKIMFLIALTWAYAFFIMLLMGFGLTGSLQLCGNIINKVYCDNYYIVKLGCSDTTVNNVFGLVHMFTVIFGLIVFILYTYLRILKVCFSGSKQTRQKAVSTCVPHLASLINFSCGVFFEIVQSRFNMTAVPNTLRVFLSLYFLTCQPLFNPVLYGLRLSKIHDTCRILFVRKKQQT
ncbi:olfactory receptor 11A1-like [Acanthochromis polyacanthus]|uniref:olfactory receptor 11A1-like n=1 Tax=Acanthochromis polyacanthus TaxID=80966 RepID=UPI0022349421|nr:olfactory receptor 11A1-like [Acanthochromis polyacanthus]